MQGPLFRLGDRPAVSRPEDAGIAASKWLLCAISRPPAVMCARLRRHRLARQPVWTSPAEPNAWQATGPVVGWPAAVQSDLLQIDRGERFDVEDQPWSGGDFYRW